MKNNILIMWTFVLISLSAIAQQNETGTVKLRGTRLTYPLVNKWIEEFSKEYPAIKVSIAPSAPADSIDFSIASYALSSRELEGNREAVVVTRYVQLPVANKERPGLAEMQTTGITEKAFGELFFGPSPPVFLASQSESPITLYVRDRPVCAVKAVATHFGNDPTTLKGTEIKGDDQTLIEAVRKDVNGLSFNNLGFIYDVKTRKISKGLAIIPLDLNENGKIDQDEQIYNTLDEVIGFIERTHHQKFVNERVNFIFDKSSKNVSAGIFLRWVLTKGQQFNHDLGFLNQDEKFLTAQHALVAATFSESACESAAALMRKRK
jgi:phosphate transport system substrate-binding protein